MKELICPYSWDCGQKFEPLEMTKYDYDFLKSATEKKNDIYVYPLPQMYSPISV